MHRFIGIRLASAFTCTHPDNSVVVTVASFADEEKIRSMKSPLICHTEANTLQERYQCDRYVLNDNISLSLSLITGRKRERARMSCFLYVLTSATQYQSDQFWICIFRNLNNRFGHHFAVFRLLFVFLTIFCAYLKNKCE